ncbi:hypothetical protein R3W88_024437 [Solanum pinnatisectum]|uniref:Bromo domain-containing protein n=1 Tax=Solanum pinnatisectum TaxID=50273 RepID=A0AAV9M3L2_9SOLN|nr:hypothetical protein R3W88_024437 [Solanum pinnatisectum]
MQKGEGQSAASCTRASMKRKFHQVREDKGRTARSSKFNSKPTKLPEKRILQLILDVLQRRDTYEIFAEPVDPTEVEDYYKIIKEPMDFGTMRAKLHEGMYHNLQQFERDAFLIPKNAMHFNSSGTVYFRQARAIYDLAKKAFHVLKTNPKNIEVEFPVNRRRSMRRLQNETRDTRHVIPDGALDVSSKNIGLGPSVPSTYRRNSKERPLLSTKDAAPIDCAFLLGNRHAQRLSSLGAGRCSTYEFFRPSPYHDTSSFLCNQNPDSLILNRNGSYRESLMSFARDLGPTAQMVANAKMQGSHPFLLSHTTKGPPTCLGFAAFAHVQNQSNTGSQKLSSPVRGFCSVLKSTSDKIDVSNVAEGDETCKIAGMSSQKGPLPLTENSEKKSSSILCYKRNVHKVTEEAAKKTQNGRERKENNLGTHIVTNGTSGDTKKPGRRSAKVEENKVLPVVLALEQSHSSLSELKWRNKKSSNFTSRKTRSQSKIAEPNVTGTILGQTKNNSFRSTHENKAAICDQNNNFGSSINPTFLEPMSQSSELKLNKTIPVMPLPGIMSSRFTFDMPFLKAQLNQMNPVGKNDMPQVSRDNMEWSLYGHGSNNKMGREVNPSVSSLQDRPNGTLQTMPTFIYNNQSSHHSIDTDLALQL